MITKAELLERLRSARLDYESCGSWNWKALDDLDNWAGSLPDDEPLNQNHAGSNEPGFVAKTTQELRQKAVQPEPSVLEIALRLMLEDVREPGRYMHPEGYVERAFAFVEAVKAEEARRAGK